MIALFQVDLIVFVLSLLMILLPGELSRYFPKNKVLEATTDIGLIAFCLSLLVFLALGIRVLCFGV